ncbi:hypothetical protein [Amycolatopsis orientalis]|uniref:hypothetical protein n=1 Tax=Amycolatopsis orientalis TaxID=31958 RepID=UPI001F24066B|nr:hypothetical protein [Amycolatopsis orientalis]
MAAERGMLVAAGARCRAEVVAVSVQPERERVSEAGCWCCGGAFPEAELVRLGSHPEVGVCLRCARWLRRRAVQRFDERHPSPAALVRGGIQSVRAAVIRNGWHRRAAVGAVLRWIDRRLP